MVKVNFKIIKLSIDESVLTAIAGFIGKSCCIQYSGEYRSLTLGFGEKIPNLRAGAIHSFKAEWEVGTYSSAWRIIQNEEILCGSMNPVESNAELEQQVESVHIGTVISIEMLSKFDIRIVLNNNMFIDFMCASVDDENALHIFGPNHLFIAYKWTDGWRIGKSNEPISKN